MVAAEGHTTAWNVQVWVSVRDNHEARVLRNRIQRAKTDRLLKEFEGEAG